MKKISGQIARIDLTRGKVTMFEDAAYYEWFGGRGYATWVYYNEEEKETGCFDAENRVIVATGCFTATNLPSASRVDVVTKSVYNGGISYASVGGNLGVEMKIAGVDALIIEGKSEKPVYLLIKERSVQIMDAESLWGMMTFQCEDTIREQLHDPRVRVGCIGPAGENFAAMACIMVDKAHAAAWGGCGAVLGSKKLKAIAARGINGNRVAFADPAGFAAESKEYNRILRASTASALLKRGGTHGMAAVGGATGLVPTSVRNSQNEYWPPEKCAAINKPAYLEFLQKRTGCYNCPLKCLHYYRMEYEGETLEGEGMHANSVRGFGSNWDCTDREGIFKAHLLCNSLGMDVDGVSTAIAWAMECWEHGLLTQEDTDGIELCFGNIKAANRVIEDMAYGRGFGKILMQGVTQAAKTIGRGTEQYVMANKNVGINEQGIRTHKAWGFAIGVSTRGSGHTSGAPQIENRAIPSEVGEWLWGFRDLGEATTYAGKAEIVAWYEDFKAVYDSTGLCYFNGGWYEVAMADYEPFTRCFNALTGLHYTSEDLRLTGERITAIEKTLNAVHAGMGRKEDYLPERIYETAVQGGKYDGEKFDRAEYDKMLDRYYAAHGWDLKTGWPLQQTLLNLGLTKAAAMMKTISER